MKRYLLFFAMISLLINSCKTATKETDEKEMNEKEAVAINPANVKEVSFDVNGMTCTGCENTVKSGVSELQGIVDVNASYLEGRVKVSFDTTLVSSSDIESAITGKGYKIASE
jgi:mercuric ion transport protein